jgi:hypothetical protein
MIGEKKNETDQQVGCCVRDIDLLCLNQGCQRSGASYGVETACRILSRVMVGYTDPCLSIALTLGGYSMLRTTLV